MQKESDEPPLTVGAVVGENLKSLRKARRWTQDAAAAQLSSRGFAWKRAHIADLESGRRETLDLGALIVLGAVLEVQLSDLFAGDGDVLLTPRADFPQHAITVTREQLRAWLLGEKTWVRIDGSEGVRAVLHGTPAQADDALAKRLGIPTGDVVAAARRLWGRSLTQERDERVLQLGDLPIEERQARQGHITRELSSDLSAWIAEGERGDG
ncbi:helix-turn-helix domain-containing protein [Streptomyces sp. NPDC001984]|uniref:helix-turn-helix domain-containing protein n=1 Tax=Streptomyces sp. NPDC002619 TaxID=3364655 RepID=UPI0036CA3286